jgi:SAM-dependent methyltransferase
VEQGLSRAASRTYGEAFYEAQWEGSRQSAAVVVPLVQSLLQPASVLDVGCGLGTWLAQWVRSGVPDVTGVDGDYVERSALLIPQDSFMAHDLSEPLSLGRRFDLVESLEVAEHIADARSDTFVQSLCSHADTVLFSAAIPGQRGSGHVNEQFPSYWIPKFERAGFAAYDCVRPSIWDDERVERWYRQNIFLFSKKTLDLPAAGARIDAVHPAVWAVRHDLTLRELVKAFPGALQRGIKGRLHPS